MIVAGGPPAAPARLETLLAALGEPLRAMLHREGELGSWLDAAIDAAHTAWPLLPTPSDAFVVYLAANIATLPDPRGYSALHTTDLALACACLQRCPQAIEAFTKRYGPSIGRVTARVGMSGAAAEEMASTLLERLFFRDEPLIIKYSGRGPLGAWVRAVAHNAAAKEIKEARRHVELDEVFDAPDAKVDPELGYLKSLYSAEFRISLVNAVAVLSVRDRTLLRQHHIDGLTVDDLGKLHRVHRATAADWLVRARDALAREVRSDLARRLSLSSRELESLLRMLRSDVRGNIVGIV